MGRVVILICVLFLNVSLGYSDDSSTKKTINNNGENKDLLSIGAIPETPLISENSSRYGFVALWNQSDWVAKSALIILLIMSLGSWTIFLSKFFEQIKTKNECIKINKASKDGFEFDKVFSELPKSCHLHLLYNAGNEAKLKIISINDAIDSSHLLSDTIQNGINDVNENLQRGLTFLATVGSTAPFVGLFGTVWAIYHALIKIGDSGQASLDKVAGPVGEALIMTAIGLAVAVPAVLGYNWLVRRNRELMSSVNKLGSILYFSFYVNR